MQTFLNEFTTNYLANDEKAEKMYASIFKLNKKQKRKPNIQRGGGTSYDEVDSSSSNNSNRYSNRRCIQSCCSLIDKIKT